MQSELKPCPFCQSKNVTDWSTGGYWEVPQKSKQARCQDCGCNAPIAAWNHRPVDASAPQIPHDAPFTDAAEITRLTEALRAAEEREKGLREALGEICSDSNPDWTERRVYPDDTLDDIHKIAVEAFYGVKI